MATKFFLCTTCGNVVVKLVDSGVIPLCCGTEMMELSQGTEDGAREKHLPVVECVDKGVCKVKVGSEPHPMTEDHHIAFIYLETADGGQIKYLKPGENPVAVFFGCCGKVRAVYAYCNVHGLWRVDCNL